MQRSDIFVFLARNSRGCISSAKRENSQANNPHCINDSGGVKLIPIDCCSLPMS